MTRNTVKLLQLMMKKSKSSATWRSLLLSTNLVVFRSKNVLIANLLVPKLVSIMMLVWIKFFIWVFIYFCPSHYHGDNIFEYQKSELINSKNYQQVEKPTHFCTLIKMKSNVEFKTWLVITMGTSEKEIWNSPRKFFRLVLNRKSTENQNGLVPRPTDNLLLNL